MLEQLIPRFEKNFNKKQKSSMKTIFCNNPQEEIPLHYFEEGSSLTLGNFDGCHLGHQDILSKTISAARSHKIPSVVFTFHPHPRELFTPKNKPKKIFSLEQKSNFFSSMGADFLIIQNFNHEFSQISCKDFYQRVLKEIFQVKLITIGSNFKFGKERKGTSDWLLEEASKDKVHVEALQVNQEGTSLISSSSIRALLEKGEVKEARKILGHSFCLEGVVVRGKGLGKSFGFPTANLGEILQTIPKPGVYAGFLMKNKKKSLAVINVGYRPTVETQETLLTVEAHALENTPDFEEAYGKKYSLSFEERLRDEHKFSSKEELMEQIRKDIKIAKKLFLQRPPKD